jgi:hypothetical protein
VQDATRDAPGSDARIADAPTDVPLTDRPPLDVSPETRMGDVATADQAADAAGGSRGDAPDAATPLDTPAAVEVAGVTDATIGSDAAAPADAAGALGDGAASPEVPLLGIDASDAAEDVSPDGPADDVGSDSAPDVTPDLPGALDAAPDESQAPDAPSLLSLGSACTTAGQCSSGACADGVCCDGACAGACEACNLPGLVGQCAPVPEGTDPGNECAPDGANVCGLDGECGPSRACRFRGASTVCAAAMCSSDAETSARTCDGAGQCAAAGAPRPCGGYTCGASACNTTCAMQSQCREGYACTGTLCELVDTTGLVGYWRLDDTTGTVAYDSSGNGNGGNVRDYGAAPAWQPTGGRLKGALVFDQSAWIQLPQSASLDSITTELSMTVWIYFEGSNNSTVIHRQAPGSATTPWYFEHYQLAIGSDRTVRTYFNNHLSGQGFSLCNNTLGPIPAQQWTHVAVTMGGGKGRVFIGGVKVCEENRSPTFGGYTRPADIGAQLEFNDLTNAIDRLRGRLDEITLWRRALTEAEVGRLANLAQPTAR